MRNATMPFQSVPARVNPNAIWIVFGLVVIFLLSAFVLPRIIGNNSSRNNWESPQVDQTWLNNQYHNMLTKPIPTDTPWPPAPAAVRESLSICPRNKAFCCPMIVWALFFCSRFVLVSALNFLFNSPSDKIKGVNNLTGLNLSNDVKLNNLTEYHKLNQFDVISKTAHNFH